MNKKNPIEKEIDKVETQWEAFIETKTPILRWLVTPGSNQLVSTFIQVQEECGDKVADFFMPLYSPISSVEDYSVALVAEMQTKVEQAGQAIEAEGELSIKWPDLSPTNHGLESLFLSCTQIIEFFGEGFENLVLVLRPSKLSTAKVWRDWWSGLAQQAANKKSWPLRLRVVVLDDAKYPILNRVCDTHKKTILTCVPPVDLKQAMTDVFDAADDGSPGAAYRKHMVALHHAVEENNLAQIKEFSEKALAIAGSHQWYNLWVAVLFLRAGAYLANAKVDDGIFDYQTAQRFAKMGHEQGTEGCGKSWIYSLLGEAGAWLTLKKWSEAASVYQQSAELSEELGEHFFQMDSWRMVCFCQEQQKLTAQAWQSGSQALLAAENLKPEEREASTLPYVGDALIRLAPTSKDKSEVEQKMTDYLGEDWKDLLAQAEPEAEAC